jgi:hypothetical protein
MVEFFLENSAPADDFRIGQANITYLSAQVRTCGNANMSDRALMSLILVSVVNENKRDQS